MKRIYILLIACIGFACTKETPKPPQASDPSKGKLAEGDTLFIPPPDTTSLKPSENQPSTKPNSTPSSSGSTTETSYSVLQGVNIENGATTLDLDYVQFLIGNRALAEAIKRGDAEEEVDDRGVKHYFVPNNYYIVNDHKNTKKVKLSPNVKVMIADAGSGKLYEGSLDELRQRIQFGSPFVVKIQKGQIVSVQEYVIP
jgi:hypothetical protein